MATINLTMEHTIVNGETVTFLAPCDCSAVTGLKITYPVESGEETKEFCFRDAHNNDLTGLGNLFAEGAVVKAILRTETGCAYIQNADTNGYLESILSEMSSVRIVTRTGTAANNVWCSIPITTNTIAVIALGYHDTRSPAQFYPGAFSSGSSHYQNNFVILPKVYRSKGYTSASNCGAGFYSSGSDSKGYVTDSTLHWYVGSDYNANLNGSEVYYFLVIDG